MTSFAPRGIRNNNPGNMDFDLKAQPWMGEIRPSKDPRFCQFDTMAHGCRALAKELITYHAKHGCNSYRQVVNRWAPPVENDTSAYVSDVATNCGAKPDDVIDFNSSSVITRLVRAIINHENGVTASNAFVLTADIQAGVLLALGLPAKS